MGKPSTMTLILVFIALVAIILLFAQRYVPFEELIPEGKPTEAPAENPPRQVQ